MDLASEKRDRRPYRLARKGGALVAIPEIETPEEVLPLTTDRVDLQVGTVTLDPGETKNGEGRTFVLTKDLRTVLTAQIAILTRCSTTSGDPPSEPWSDPASRAARP